MKLLCMIAVFLCIPWVASDAQKQDWGNLKRYAEANKELVRKGKQKDRVVFMGNSITEGWVANDAAFFELARGNKIKVILTSVLPAAAFGWNPSVKDAPQKIMQLNARIRKYAQENKIPYVDYYSEMVEGDNKALNSSYTRDGVHPTLEGYKVMEALIKKAIDKVL